MSGSAYSFTRKIIFLGRIVSPCTYTSFCRAITFDNQPWLFAWKRAASVSVSRVNFLYNPCDEFLVRFFPLPCLRCFRAIAPVSVFRRRAPRRRHNFTRKTARCLLSQLSRCFKDEQAYIEAAISKLYIYIYIYRATRIAERPRPHCERPKGHGTASAWFRWEYGLKYRGRIIIMER